MPSLLELERFITLIKEIIFPGYYNNHSIDLNTLPYYLGVKLDKVIEILEIQIQRGLCFEFNAKGKEQSMQCAQQARELAGVFIEKLPNIKNLLYNDVDAAFAGDPAAKSPGEIIYCYPTITALTHHRIAHALLEMSVPLIPRIISEMAHSQTGIDIHPGAEIGERFMIDHGTGVVVGETCIIGNNVKLYQGVTLGAKSFPVDENGNPIKGIPRHPIVEDHVIIYSGATILGRVTIGANSVIGGNVWVTTNVSPNSRVIQQRAKETYFTDGAGI